MIINIDGNLFDTKADIICHQCNCQGKMGTGVALQVKQIYPEVFKAYYNDYEKGLLKLGYVSFAENSKGQIIANMCGQEKYGYDGNKYTNYDKLQECMDKVKQYAIENNLETIAFPYLMSCHLGGGDWNIVSEMIKNTFQDFTVEIHKFKKEN